MALVSYLKRVLFGGKDKGGNPEPLTCVADPSPMVESDGHEPDPEDREPKRPPPIKHKLIPYDHKLNNNLTELCLGYWKVGDWNSLVSIDLEAMTCHPERATLAMMIAGAYIELGNLSATSRFACLARQWGCDRLLMSKILLAGISKTFGRLELILGQDEKGISRFNQANQWISGLEKPYLSAEEHAVRESMKLGFLTQTARLINRQYAVCKSSSHNGSEADSNDARFSIIETELQLLHNELSLAQQRQQLFSIQKNPGNGGFDLDASDWLEWVKKKAVSQLGQELWVLEKSCYKRNGFFVEFGATDGVLLSNTWLLEKLFDWKGICAEPNPKFFSQLKNNRSCMVSDACIGDETGKCVDFVLADVYGGISSHANLDNHAAKREAYRQAAQVKQVQLISLDDFLRQHNAPCEIDYISIDTEGSEYDILSSFPFQNWRIRLFTIEHNYTKHRQAIRSLMEENGYQCTEIRFDDWYELKG